MCTCREGAELAKYVCAHKRLPTQRKGGASRALERQACRAAPPRLCSDNRQSETEHQVCTEKLIYTRQLHLD